MTNTRARLVYAGPLTLGAILLASPAGVLGAAEGESTVPSAAIVAALDALARQPAVAYTARRRLEGELVSKGERAWMEVSTRFEPGRGLTHTVLAEGGSHRIRERALSSVLAKEIESTCAEEARRAAFSSDNYRYRLLDAPLEAVRIELLPKRSDVRLLKGTALVAADDGALRRIEGQLAQNPSFWVRDVRVERTYAQFGHATLPVELVSTARIRMFGDARLRILTTYSTVDGRPVH